MPTPVADGLDLLNAQIKNVGDPTAPGDAVNRQWVENFLAGLSWKDEVVAASTGNVSVTSAPASIDGVALAANDRVLLKDQTDAKENGIRVFTATGAALNRASDADTGAELRAATVSVLKGTVNADSLWVQTADDVVIGTSNITFARFNAGVTYTGTGGVQINGTVISVQTQANGGIIAEAAGLKVDPAIVARVKEFLIGDGSALTFTLAHNLGPSAQIQVYDVSVSPAQKILDNSTLSRTSPFNMTTRFASAPAANRYLAVIQAAG